MRMSVLFQIACKHPHLNTGLGYKDFLLEKNRTDRWNRLHCVVLCCVALRCVALRCVALRCVALCCAVLCCVAHIVIPQHKEHDLPSQLNPLNCGGHLHLYPLS